MTCLYMNFCCWQEAIPITPFCPLTCWVLDSLEDSVFLINQFLTKGCHWELPDYIEKEVCDSSLDFELFHRKEELCCSSSSARTVGSGGYLRYLIPCACSKGPLKVRLSPWENMQIFHILGCQVVVQITAGVPHLGGLSCSWIARVRIHDHTCQALCLH